MVQDDLEDPTNPLSEPFQEQVLERGKRIETLRSLARSDARTAREFEALVAEQLLAYEQLLSATQRFPAGDPDDPASKFRAAMAREIQKLRDDAEWSRSVAR